MTIIYHRSGAVIYRYEVKTMKYFAIAVMGPSTYQLEEGAYTGHAFTNNSSFKEWDAALAKVLAFVGQFPTRE